MLSEEARLLLSAAVAGDLSPRQRWLVRRWLKRSPEARRYFQQLQQDRSRLKNLPPAELPVDFSRTVMAAIGPNGPVKPIWPAQPAFAPRRPFWSVGAPWAVAAGLFLTLSLGSYLFFRSHRAPIDRPSVAIREGQGRGVIGAPPPPGLGALVEVHPPTLDPSNPGEPLPDQSTPNAVVEAPQPKPATASPPSASPVLTSDPKPPLEAIKTVRGQLPLVLVPRDLQEPSTRQKLLDELHKFEVVHVDLAVPVPSRACERLQAVFQGMGLQVYADPLAHERLKRRLPEFPFAIYLNAVKPEELALVLHRFGDGDRKREERAFVGPLQPNDSRDFIALTGIDLLPARRSRSAHDLGTHKSVAEPTTSQSSPAKPAAGPRTALIFAYPPLKKPILTREMRQILEARPARPAGQMGALLVVR